MNTQTPFPRTVVRPKHIAYGLIGWAILLLIVFLFGSCVSVKKAESKLDENPIDAANYCMLKYPVDTLAKTETSTPDTASNNHSLIQIMDYADSLFYELLDLRDSLNSLPGGDIKKSAALATSAPAMPLSLVKFRLVDSLKQELEKRLKMAYQPCYTITKTYTVEATGKVEYFRLLYQREQDSTKTVNTKLVTRTKQRNWLFFLLLGAAVWIGRKPILTLLKLIPV